MAYHKTISRKNTDMVKEDPQMFFDNLITSKELLDLLGNRISRSTLQWWMKCGCPTMRLGGRLYFQKPDVIAWIKSNSVAG